MAQEYATKATAAALAGVATTDINDAQVDLVNKYIEQMTGRNFGVENSHIQYFDVEGSEDTFQLINYPVISLTEIRDNQRDSVIGNQTVLVEDTDYTIDKQAGIVKLIKDDFNVLKGSTGLTVGTKTVKITYTWGYSSTPEDVSMFADYMLAWLAESTKEIGSVKNDSGAILRRIQIGDYQEAYDSKNDKINAKYQKLLSDMSQQLVSKYKKYGESDADYYPII